MASSSGQLISLLLIGVLVQAITTGHTAQAGLLSRSSSSNDQEAPTTTLAPGQLSEAKPNKVSKVLHMVHDKAGEYIYGSPDEQVEQGEEAAAAAAGEDQAENYGSMSDDEVISSACDRIPKKFLCQKAVKRALKRPQEERAKIAAAIRNKPAKATASKVLYHTIFGIGVQKLEAKGYDETADRLITLAATKNPYGFVAVKALDMMS